MLFPQPGDYCQFGADDKAKLIVVIDTEEEFNWSELVSRDNKSVLAMRSITRIQEVFDEYGITPVYVVDYPVASQRTGYELLQEINADGRCLIGAHLHPWVNPPHQESVNQRNSFPGNLPRELESSKLQILGDCIESSFGSRPTIYKAGRYGVGPNTAEILEEQGYKVDLSIRAHADFSNIDGPNFSYSSAWPFWFGKHRQLLEVPVASGFSGLFRRWGASLHTMALRPSLQRFRVRGIMKRIGLLKKLDLSPEASSLSELTTLVPILHADGLKVFGFAFHSPSLEPGNTPYVTSNAELEQFVARCRGFFEWFLGDFGGIASQPLEIRNSLKDSCGAESVHQ